MWLISLLTACTGWNSQNVDCDLMAVASVNVELSAEEGGDIEEAEVTWSVDGGEPQPCETWDPGIWVCGWEVAGDITVTADGWGFAPVSETVFIEQDTCHVVPQWIELELPPVDCAAVEMPGVLVDVVDEAGAPIADAEVAYAPRDEDWTAPEPCEDQGGGEFACAWGRWGLLDVEAHAEGLQSAYAEVDVPSDECGPITQTLTLTLAP
ncbi:MAG: hypothetical protein H6741_23190 [Alphaproteobacteria bacterium]|nr:hypothetical protein [Alphaproteobacteria bacterium]